MTLDPLPLVLAGALLVATMMLALWVVQRRTGVAGVVDIGWTAGLGLLAILYAVLGGGDLERRVLMGAMAGIWSLRLTGHLVQRGAGSREDGRYVTLKAEWGERAQPRLFWFFQAQGALDVILSATFLVVAFTARPGLDALDYVGLGIWVIAVGGELVADRQLDAFRKDPANRGRTCRGGLWRYSRHPNYFFEWMHWLAYVPLAWGSPWAVATLAAPAILLFLVLKVTGIPPTEAQALKSRGDDYREYQRTTSAFFPLPPRRGDRLTTGAT